jgi:4-oxalmesaconate hydratase
VIIDCHGHYTTAPPALREFRDAQLAALRDGTAQPGPPVIGDDELAASVADQQLRVMRERGTDLMILSPRASGMAHHVGDPAVARAWARVNNDLVHRVAGLHPGAFAPACQLPQTPGGDLADAVAELARCVEELGFVGCLLNPDPSGGYWQAKPLTDPYWFPLYDELVRLDVPAMIHVSASVNPGIHDLGAHYLNADTSVFMQLLRDDLFERYPTLRFVIPHGGGAVPYHWGRYRGLAVRLDRPPPERLLRNVFFDTAVYQQPGIDLLARVIPAENILFAAEVLGAVRGVNPDTGAGWDHTRLYLDRAGFTEAAAANVYAGNARRVYPRIEARLTAS